MKSLASFDTIFGRSPSCAPIPIKQEIETKIWIFEIIYVQKIFPSEQYVMITFSFQNTGGLLPVKKPFRSVTFDAY